MHMLRWLSAELLAQNQAEVGCGLKIRVLVSTQNFSDVWNSCCDQSMEVLCWIGIKPLAGGKMKEA